MQPRSSSSRHSDATRTLRAGAPLRAGLAAAHAEALHRLVPPVYFDDDGYVCEDSSHLPESEVHFPILSYWQSALYARYAALGRRVCVLADMLLLVDREVGTAAVVPDVLVAFDVDPGDRLSYKVWQEPKAPDLVLEVLSEETWKKDVFHKPGLYADLGVREYWIFDPRGIRRGGPPLEGWRLHVDAAHDPLPVADGAGHSALLGLDLVPEGRKLWLRDPESNEVLPDYAGAMELRDRAERARDRAERARDRAERALEQAQAENAELLAQLRRLRADESSEG
ncbi:MAG: Uma2 family endonuclease [Gammaproteobacteria bacterium]|nr:Uma2 family endonuclease [Gammaproteobacteria bacterium]